MSSASATAEARAREHPPERILERLAFEPEAGLADAVAHLAGCAACSGAVERLLAERERFLALRPSRPFAARVLEVEAAKGLRRLRWTRIAPWGLGAAAAAAVAVLWIAPRGGAGQFSFKGAPPPALVLFASPGQGPARPLDPGATLHPGDIVRFGVRTTRPAHVLVASVDAEGRFTLYHPQAEDRSARVDGREPLHVLAGSVALDETLGREWFVLLLSEDPLSRAAVEPALLRAWRERSGETLGPIVLAAEAHVLLAVKERR
jgi:hypothetical protein